MKGSYGIWGYERTNRQFADGNFEGSIKSLQLPVREGLKDAAKMETIAQEILRAVSIIRTVDGAPDPRPAFLQYTKQYVRELDDVGPGSPLSGSWLSGAVSDSGLSDSDSEL